MALSRRDLARIFIVGAGVGLLIQPILGNNIPAAHAAFLSLPVRFGIFIFFTLFAPFALWVAQFVSRWFHGLYQFAQFAAVGTLNSFLYDGIFNVETALYGSTIINNWLFAVFISVAFLFSTTNSFIWNKYWTFASGGKTNAGELGGFYGVALVGWALSVGLATFVKSIGPVDSRTWVNIVAPLCGILASFIWNFLGYKFWVFKKKK